MSFIYVALFSNGHIKVGRSISPESRIASHADRVACVGIDLMDSIFFKCVSSPMLAESSLIDWCALNARQRNKSEWFDGLSFIDVVHAAKELSLKAPPVTNRSEITPQQMIIELMAIGVTQEEIAEASGLTQGRISHIKTNGGDCSFDSGTKLARFFKSKTAKANA